MTHTLCSLPLRAHGLNRCCALACSLALLLYCIVYHSAVLHSIVDSRKDRSTLLALSLMKSIDSVGESCWL
jgi:hypothetical protein